MFEAVLRALGETVFPARCIGCACRGTALCETCRAELPYLPAGLCARCAGRRGSAGAACRGCRRLSPSLTTIHAAFVYEGAARNAVLTLNTKASHDVAACEAISTWAKDKPGADARWAALDEASRELAILQSQERCCERNPFVLGRLL